MFPDVNLFLCAPQLQQHELGQSFKSKRASSRYFEVEKKGAIFYHVISSLKVEVLVGKVRHCRVH